MSVKCFHASADTFASEFGAGVGDGEGDEGDGGEGVGEGELDASSPHKLQERGHPSRITDPKES
jgi:hypothetical protein